MVDTTMVTKEPREKLWWPVGPNVPDGAARSEHRNVHEGFDSALA